MVLLNPYSVVVLCIATCADYASLCVMVKQTLGNFSCGALIWAGPLNILTVVLMLPANQDCMHAEEG